MEIEVKIINSFSIDNAGGNPAGVVLHADSLSSEQKQLIAKEARLSETAFVSRSAEADFKLEFFTPTKQIAHCGHATIATFSYLKSIGIIRGTTSSKETIDGTRKILFEENEAYMEQSAPIFEDVKDKIKILDSLSINDVILDQSFPIVTGNTGNSFLLIGIKHESTLASLKPDFKLIDEISRDLNCIGYYVFALTDGAFDAQTRMFAPTYGINEESATGMAAGPLAGLLYTYGRPKGRYTIGQGNYMSPSSAGRLHVNVNAGPNGITNLMAGGDAYISQTIFIQL
jgi:PhzF family phenazine biosynthesis protein